MSMVDNPRTGLVEIEKSPENPIWILIQNYVEAYFTKLLLRS